MNMYKIFRSPLGKMEAVKQGFSWPGFFFVGIWMLVKGMWSYAGILIACLFAFFFVVAMSGIDEVTFSAIQSMVNLGLGFYCGFKGNELREKYMLEHGFEYKDTVTAPNSDMALAIYIRDHGSN